MRRPLPDLPKSGRPQHGNHILLRGISQTGKTTLVNQMRVIYGNDYSSSERLDAISTLIANLLDGFAIILKESLACGSQSQIINPSVYKKLAEDLEHETRHIGSAITMRNIWEDHTIQSLIRSSNDIFLPENFHHWIYSFHAIAHQGHLPTDRDILSTWVQTTGIHVSTFGIEQHTVRVTDAGGARAERKKWYRDPAASQADRMIYIAPLIGYSQRLLECEQDYQHTESRQLFSSLLDHHAKNDTSHMPITLILSKKDLLPHRLRTHPYPSASSATVSDSGVRASRSDFNTPSASHESPTAVEIGTAIPMPDLREATSTSTKPPNSCSSLQRGAPAVIQQIKPEYEGLAQIAGRDMDVYVLDLTDTEAVREVLDRIIGQTVGK